MRHILATAATLMALWLLLSGHFEPLILISGIVSSLALAWFSYTLNLIGPGLETARFAGRSLRYLPWLFWQIIRSNIAVARIILRRDMPINPQIVRVPQGQRTELGTAVHANSITLTPGTLSLDVNDAGIEVHVLADAFARDLEGGEFDRRVRALEPRT